MSPPPPPKISQATWDRHKPEILELYPGLQRTELLEHLKNKHGFCPTVAQYERQKKKWRLRKNVTREQWISIQQMAQARPGNNQETEIVVHNRVIHPQQIKKAARWVAAKSTTPKRPQNNHNTSGAVSDGIPVSTPPAAMDARIVRSLDTPFAQFETLLEECIEKYRRPISSADVVSATAISAVPNDISAGWQTSQFNLQMMDPSPTNQSSLQSAEQDEFSRKGKKLLAESLAAVVDPDAVETADLDSPEYTERIASLLRNVIVERRKGDFEKHARLIAASHLDRPFQLLRYMVYLCSNNLLDPSNAYELLDWILDSDSMWAVEELIALDTAPTDIFASALLNSAVQLQKGDTVRMLLRASVDPNFTTIIPEHSAGASLSTLDEAVEIGDADLVRLLVQNCAESRERPWQTFLAEKTGDCSSASYRSNVQFLIDNCVDANEVFYEPKHPTTVFQKVIESTDLEAAKILLTSGASVNSVSEDVATPLQIAAGVGNLEVVELLIQAGADVDAPLGSSLADVLKWGIQYVRPHCLLTPLQVALAQGEIEVANVLLRHGACVNGLNATAYLEVLKEEVAREKHVSQGRWLDDDDCLRHKFKFAGGEFRARFWQDHSHDGDCRFRRAGFLNSPLQAAAAGGDLAVARRLLSLGATIDLIGGYGTALQVAASQKGNLDMVKLLLNEGADINADAQDPIGHTALQAAILYGDHETILFLLESGADVNSAPSFAGGNTALQAAIKRGDMILAKLLIVLGADINAKASALYGGTCIQIATKMENIHMADLLLKHGANPHAPPSEVEGNTAILAAVSINDIQVVQRLLEHKLNPATTAQECADQYTQALCCSVRECPQEMTRLLLDHGANPNGITGEDNPLAAAIRTKKLQIVQLLIEYGADVHALDNGDDESMLQIAASVGSLPLCRALIEAGLGLQGSMGTAALHSAVRNHKIEVIRFLLSEGTSPNWDTGPRPEYCAALSSPISAVFSAYGDFRDYTLRPELSEILEIMLSHGARFDADDRIGREVCHLPLLIIRRLIEGDLDLSHAAANPIGGEPLLQYASYKGLRDFVQLLLDIGADIDFVPEKGGTALQRAVEGGHTDIVNLLLSKGADVNAPLKDRYGNTALRSAVVIGSLPLVLVLLRAGADVGAVGSTAGFWTALQTAAMYGRLDIAYVLINEDKEPETLRTRCDKALEQAEFFGFPILASMLLEWSTR